MIHNTTNNYYYQQLATSGNVDGETLDSETLNNDSESFGIDALIDDEITNDLTETAELVDENPNDS